MVNENTIEFIYGDLTKFNELSVKGKIKDIINMNADIDHYLEQLGDLPVLYIEFILGKLGYDSTSDDHPPFPYSTFKKDNWVDYAIPPWREEVPVVEAGYEAGAARYLELNGMTDVLKFCDTNGKRLVIHLWKSTPKIFTESAIVKKMNELEEWEISEKPDIIISHPILINNNEFTLIKEKVEKLIGRDIFYNAIEFLTKIGVGQDKIPKMKSDWKEVRDKVLIDLTKRFPIITIAMNENKILDIENCLRKARIELEKQQYDIAFIISNCGKAIEAILQILDAEYNNRPKKLGFNELLNLQKHKIEDIFGIDIIKDIDFIIKYRNIVSHANDEQPDYIIAMKVYGKADLIYKIFNKVFLTIQTDTQK